MDILTILSPVLGGLGRLATGWLDYRNKKLDYEQELKLLEMNSKIEEMRANARIRELTQETEMHIETNWSAALEEAMASIGNQGNNSFIGALNNSVRPVLTYWWCLVLYSAYKILFIIHGLRTDSSLLSFSQVIFTEFDAAVTGSIFGFWFLDRALRKVSAK